MRTCWIIAGPNGAGKTTFALDYLPQIAKGLRFINADLIASGLSPLAPEQQTVAASRLFLHELNEALLADKDFAFETTLSGRSYLNLVKRIKKEGWRVELIYLALPNKEMSAKRVAKRVVQGGHNIPFASIERRFSRSLSNLIYRFSPLVDYCVCFMNIGDVPIKIFHQYADKSRVVFDEHYYQHLIRSAENET